MWREALLESQKTLPGDAVAMHGGYPMAPRWMAPKVARHWLDQCPLAAWWEESILSS